jgi:hypothetical protein
MKPFMAGFLAVLWLSSQLLLRAADSKDTRPSLRGLKTIAVVVEHISGDRLDANADGLNEQDLQTSIELRCRMAGVKVANPGDADAFLYISIVATGKGLYALGFNLELLQSVVLQRDPGISVFADTWSTGAAGTVLAKDLAPFCREHLRDLVDQFLNAYFEQNPKSSTSVPPIQWEHTCDHASAGCGRNKTGRNSVHQGIENHD